MKKLIFLFFLIAFFYRPSFATVVEANNPDYAGKKLIFSIYTDPVTGGTQSLFSLMFDNSGKAKAVFDISKTTYVFCDFGVYRGMMFAESEKSVELQLPPVRGKVVCRQKKPIFQASIFLV